MATPTSLPAAVATGDVGTAAQFNGLRGAFRVLQVVHASTTSLGTSTSGTYVDSTLTATITPQSATSQILCIVSQAIYTQGATTGCGLKIVRAGTTIDTYVDLNYGTASGVVAQQTFTILDSPATTSATIYKTQFARSIGASTVYTQVNGNPSRITLMEISA